MLRATSATFGEVGLELIMRKDVASATELSGRRHLDGFVIDCDDVPGAIQVITHLRGNPPNKHPVVIAVVNGRTSTSQALALGANFVLAKPFESSSLRALLDLALPKMEREHRRYFRYQVNLSIDLRASSEQSLRAKMLNISEGGLAVQISEPLTEATLRVQFDLPAIRSEKFEARAVMVWSCSSVAGLQFIHIESRCRENFHSWLNSLEAQSRFRASTF